MTKIQSAYQLLLRREAEQLLREAETLPCGRAKDAMLQRVRRLERSATTEGWINSPGLRCPQEKHG